MVCPKKVVVLAMAVMRHLEAVSSEVLAETGVGLGVGSLFLLQPTAAKASDKPIR